MTTGPRVGLGFDVHPRDEARPLWLGGVRFDGEPGLAGHSDGDAVCHALAGIAGTDLLRRTVELLAAADASPSNCDITVVCERPAIGPRRDEIRAALAGALGIAPASVSVKATRPEGLGLAGDGAGCLAIAVVA